MSSDQLQSLVARLESVTTRLESVAQQRGAAAASSSVEQDVDSPMVLAYSDLTGGAFKKAVELTDKIGGDVKTLFVTVQEVFSAQRDFLRFASTHKKPNDSVLQQLLTPTSSCIQRIQEFREKNRTSKQFNHLSAISESIPALGWVAIAPAPAPYVKEMADASQFYTNRVLKDFKEKEPIHADWVKAWLQVLTELQAFVKQHHTTGLAWNAAGAEATEAPKKARAGPPAPPAPPGGPAPPPPPPPSFADLSAPASDDARAALFAELNKGTGVTAGLRRVTDDQKTHKNPALRQAPAPYKPPTAPKPNLSGAPAAKKPEPKKTPVLRLEDKKWEVEHQIGQTLTIDTTDMKQQVYIFKCENSTITVNGKINSISCDSCKKVGIIFDDLVSTVEFVNCQRMQAQANGKVPTVSVDKTDGCHVYLSQSATDAEIVCAKSSEVNILVPDENGEYREFALPEQFKSTWNGKGYTTQPTESV